MNYKLLSIIGVILILFSFSASALKVIDPYPFTKESSLSGGDGNSTCSNLEDTSFCGIVNACGGGGTTINNYYTENITNNITNNITQPYDDSWINSTLDSNYIPYNGANKNVNLNNQSISNLQSILFNSWTSNYINMDPDGNMTFGDNSGVYTLRSLAAGGSGGSGDVVGPSGADNDYLTLFEGTTGKVIKESAQLYYRTGFLYMPYAAAAGYMSQTGRSMIDFVRYDDFVYASVDFWNNNTIGNVLTVDGDYGLRLKPLPSGMDLPNPIYNYSTDDTQMFSGINQSSQKSGLWGKIGQPGSEYNVTNCTNISEGTDYNKIVLSGNGQDASTFDGIYDKISPIRVSTIFCSGTAYWQSESDSTIYMVWLDCDSVRYYIMKGTSGGIAYSTCFSPAGADPVGSCWTSFTNVGNFDVHNVVTDYGTSEIQNCTNTTITGNSTENIAQIIAMNYNTSNIEIGDNITGNVSIPVLTGSGNSYLCIDANGRIYRSDSACA